MGWFNRKKQLPAFPGLQAYEALDQYFLRTAQWRWLNTEMITVIDPHGPRILTLDPWPQLVFLAADGAQTVSEYVYDMALKYSGAIPERLDATIIHEIKTLLSYRIIVLSDQPRKPENYLMRRVNYSSFLFPIHLQFQL